MEIQDLGAIGDLIGGVAIIVSLIYVGVQIKQSTAASRAATYQAFSQQYTQHMVPLQRADFRDIFLRGLGDADSLDAGEKVAFFSYLNGVLRMFEAFYLQQKDGSFESSIYEPWAAQLVDLLGNSGAKSYWKIRRHTFHVEFADHIDNLQSNSNPRPMYGKKSGA